MKNGSRWLAKIISSMLMFIVISGVIILVKVALLPAKGINPDVPALDLKLPEETISQDKVAQDQIKTETGPEMQAELQTQTGIETKTGLETQIDPETEIELEPISNNIFEKILKQRRKMEMEHFHNLDSRLDTKKIPPRLCLLCHGNYPHLKSKETRSLYNMHATFCACEVCHIKPKEGKLAYFWFDDLTQARVTDVSNIERRLTKNFYTGLYDARIAPCVQKEGKYYRLDQPITEEYAKKYLNIWMQYSYDQKSKAKVELHKRLTHTPAICIECHVQDKPLLDLLALGYPKQFSQELAGQEMSAMIGKYTPEKRPEVFPDNPQFQERKDNPASLQ